MFSMLIIFHFPPHTRLVRHSSHGRHAISMPIFLEIFPNVIWCGHNEVMWVVIVIFGFVRSRRVCLDLATDCCCAAEDSIARGRRMFQIEAVKNVKFLPERKWFFFVQKQHCLKSIFCLRVFNLDF